MDTAVERVARELHRAVKDRRECSWAHLGEGAKNFFRWHAAMALDALAHSEVVTGTPPRARR
jgi:hypothetical protein